MKSGVAVVWMEGEVVKMESPGVEVAFVEPEPEGNHHISPLLLFSLMVRSRRKKKEKS